MPVSDAVFWMLFLAVLAMLPCIGWISRRMRSRHPGLHERLRLDQVRDSGEFVRFLWRREYLRLDDPALARMCDAVRTLLLAHAVGFAGLFAWLTLEDVREEQVIEAAALKPSGDQRRDEAYRLHREKKWSQAIAIYDELLGEIGADAEMVYYRGNARASLRRYGEALVDYRRVMDLEPGKYEAYLAADRILSAQRRFDDCVDLWTRYLRVAPGSADAFYERGGSHFHRGDFEGAIADARKACELGKGEACSRVQWLEKRRVPTSP